MSEVPDEFSEIALLVHRLKFMAASSSVVEDAQALLAAADYIPQLWDAGFRAGVTAERSFGVKNLP